MKHYGDITKMSGETTPPVDVVTFGAPCQDLSVAGKRKGMKHEAHGDKETTRSGLFYEAIRVIKELREHDRNTGRPVQFIRPRYAIYENVPGAFSSGNPKGADFAAVLEEIVKIVQPEAPAVSVPVKGWPNAGGLYGVGTDGQPFSVAWRVHDAQYWGVPQRRRRLCVLADFNGLTAPWLLFDAEFVRAAENGEPYQTVRDTGNEPRPEVPPVRESLSRHTEPSGTAGQGTTPGTESGALGTVSFQERAGKPGGGKGILIQPEHTGALSTLNNQSVFAQPYGIGAYNSEGMKSDNPHSGIYKADTSRTLDLTGGSPACNQGGGWQSLRPLRATGRERATKETGTG